MEHRLYDTGDQIWVEDGQTVKLISHDGMMWESGQQSFTRSHSLYHMSSDGSQTWFGQRYGQYHVIKIASHDGRIWSEEEPIVKQLTGVEGGIHRVQSFLSSLILKVLS